ncbi:Uncharacterised protein [Vibrio cholerae]|uniref:Uncharacterized protein n=1 Tax=Vibrio cholerae TaxID=666 RepID=A0A655QRN8_VIBCL|nr:Uncharacterised protein [Vibrio cholerae]CSA68216.1 Uncharacterised protein [Vibrio cholerae]CSC03624.1 Uncharacterised protein [Vibrio cholerae]CSC08521.1 Uncharacterised protein [Vibrio cholerae]CSC27245.1 Uncharacterised protein [Vibrio cholerae]
MPSVYSRPLLSPDSHSQVIGNCVEIGSTLICHVGVYYTVDLYSVHPCIEKSLAQLTF